MRLTRNKLGMAVLALVSCASLPVLGWAQKPHPDRPPTRQVQPHVPQPHPQNPNANRPPSNPNFAKPQGQTGGNPNNGVTGSQNKFNNEAGVHNGTGANFAPRQPIGAARPWVDQMRSLTPQQREQVLRNSRTFQNLSPDKQNKIRQQFNQWDRMTPQQRRDLQTKEDVWRNLTPAQRDHIKNDVLPRMNQMPWERQQMINQKLRVLQNMPESARNQRLNDPNFTKGMSDDEKSMLHDLSHTHVGGAPEPPSE